MTGILSPPAICDSISPCLTATLLPAVGLEQIVVPDYLEYRIASTGYLGGQIADHGVPIVEPPGGHAI